MILFLTKYYANSNFLLRAIAARYEKYDVSHKAICNWDNHSCFQCDEYLNSYWEKSFPSTLSNWAMKKSSFWTSNVCTILWHWNIGVFNTPEKAVVKHLNSFKEVIWREIRADKAIFLLCLCEHDPQGVDSVWHCWGSGTCPTETQQQLCFGCFLSLTGLLRLM